jgi:hypothetical protein
MVTIKGNASHEHNCLMWIANRGKQSVTKGAADGSKAVGHTSMPAVQWAVPTGNSTGGRQLQQKVRWMRESQQHPGVVKLVWLPLTCIILVCRLSPMSGVGSV